MRLENESYDSDDNFRVGRYESISQAFMENPWMFKFVSGICDYYGMPCTSEECSSKRERMMYAWAVSSVIGALSKYRILWLSGFEKYDLEILIPSFIESYRELAGCEVIQPMGSGEF